VVDAFHWALLLRIDSIASHGLAVNTKSTELQENICEMKNFARGVLKVQLLLRSIPAACERDDLTFIRFAFLPFKGHSRLWKQ